MMNAESCNETSVILLNKKNLLNKKIRTHKTDISRTEMKSTNERIKIKHIYSYLVVT